MCFTGHECKSEGLFLYVLQHRHAYVDVTHTYFHVHISMHVCAQWLRGCVHDGGSHAAHVFAALLAWVCVAEPVGWVGPMS